MRNDLIEAVEQLLHPRQASAEEIDRVWRPQENERMLTEKEAALANVGPTFRISEVTGWLSPIGLGSYLRKACLIGETGKAYMYDVGQDAAAQATASVNEREFSQPVDLAKSLGHVEWRRALLTTLALSLGQCRLTAGELCSKSEASLWEHFPTLGSVNW